MDEGTRTLALIAFVFVFVLAVLWFLLPFAIFGTKDILSKILEQQTLTNQKLDQLINKNEPKT